MPLDVSRKAFSFSFCVRMVLARRAKRQTCERSVAARRARRVAPLRGARGSLRARRDHERVSKALVKKNS
eukprot:scaffold305753_cov26-Tisochrysis_lutea.AAC.1